MTSTPNVPAGRYVAIVDNELTITDVSYQVRVKNERTGKYCSATTVERIVRPADADETIKRLADLLPEWQTFDEVLADGEIRLAEIDTDDEVVEEMYETHCGQLRLAVA